jgi:hypothetical protein
LFALVLKNSLTQDNQFEKYQQKTTLFFLISMTHLGDIILLVSFRPFDAFIV